jgi:hypothetical protein
VSNDAILYGYANVGQEVIPVNDGVLYGYVNVGAFATVAWLGRVVGFAGPGLIGFLYGYVNIDAAIFDPGGLRVLEDGTPRYLEDDTTQRTLEDP